MSTQPPNNPYFLLSKPNHGSVDNNTDNQLVYLNRRKIFLLPEINIDYYSKNGLFECQLIEWCKQFCKPDQIFLDIGAHTGTYSISLAEHCREVYSFEPQRATYYALCGGVALSNIRNIVCCNVGLGSAQQVGYQLLHIVSEDGGGSTVHQPASGILGTETIEIRTLDSFELSNVGFIKMDVEENELFVLQGATKTLERSGFPPIIFESNIETNTALFDYLRDVLKYNVIKIAGCINMYLGEPMVPPNPLLII
jgi:FkbM family methyltransferase